MSNIRKNAVCPSVQCKEGVNLLGILQSNGQVTFFSQRFEVDHEFVQTAALGREPEKRFRFSGKCITNACRHWTNDKCGLIKDMIREFTHKGLSSSLPECSIRKQCRWFVQEGARACKICPLISTNIDDLKSPGKST
jgi:hypothetical protein